MPSSGRHWRRDVLWASVYGVAAIVLPVRSLQIALHLDELRRVATWQDWLVGLALALALGVASGCYARWAVLARERWAWCLATMTLSRSTGHSAGAVVSSAELPVVLSGEWWPLWLRIPLSLLSIVAWLMAIASLLAGMYWGSLIVASLVDPTRFVFNPMLREHFMSFYLVMLIFPFGLFWFGALGMVWFPCSTKVIVDDQGMTRVSALGRRHTLRWDDARLLMCDGGDARSDLSSYKYWALIGPAATIQWDDDLADFAQRAWQAHFIYEHTGLEPYTIKQSFWRRAPLAAHLVHALPTTPSPESDPEPA